MDNKLHNNNNNADTATYFSYQKQPGRIQN